MTPIELKDYILRFMTAEEALVKLLDSSVEFANAMIAQQERDPAFPEVSSPMMVIVQCAAMLDWEIAIEKDQENVEGLVIGTEEYMKRHII